MKSCLLCAAAMVFALVAGCASTAPPPPSREPLSADAAAARYAAITPSLVAIEYAWQNELGRHDYIGAGVVIGNDGLVMASATLFPVQMPDEQMKEFKIIVPRQEGDPLELDAVFMGRDERTDLAFLRTREPQKWKSIHFVENPPAIGDFVYSVGLMSKEAGYRSYYMSGNIATTLRGEIPQLVVNGELAAVGSPVFNSQGQAIGVVAMEPGQNPLLNIPGESLTSILIPPRLFTPTRFFGQSFSDLPSPGKPIPIPWLGIPQMTGLTKDVADIFNLKGQPAIQVGEVIHDGPADRGGLKQGDVIVKVNGQPLERGDQPEELPLIFERKLVRMKPGEQLALSVLHRRGEPLQELRITLDERPARPNTAKRYFADDLGFGVRNLVFYDTYARHLAADAKGVVVAVLRPQGSAESGGLHMNDMIQRLNGQLVNNVDDFQKNYEQLRKEKPRENVVLVVLRDGREDTIRVEPPR